MTLLVAQVAVATSISPVDLLNTPPDIFFAMVGLLKQQARERSR
jgi:hypothetical protein